MAFVQDPNQQQQQNQVNQGSAPSGQSATAAPNVSGGSGGDVGTGSSAGVGSGGTGSFANIQAYLNANQGDTGSAQNLTNQAQGQFSKEQGQMQDQSNQALQAGQNAVNQQMTTDQAGQKVQDAANQYNWNANSGQNAGYTQDVNQVQGALNGQFTGPNSFAYGLSADTQNYGNNLQNDQGFKTMMNNIYSQQAGSPLTSGQSALQGQLDTNNTALNQARQNMIGAYGNLQGQANDLNQSTTNALQGDQSQYTQNQNALKGYLTGQAGNYDSAINTAEQNAQAGYQNSYHGDQTGQQAAFYGSPMADPNNTYNFGGVSQAANMTPQQLQQEQDVINADKTAGGYQNEYSDIVNSPGAWFSPQYAQQATANQGALGNWYQNQANQYANTAQPQKADWNAIQDFLGTNTQRQGQYYDVGAPGTKLPGVS